VGETDGDAVCTLVDDATVVAISSITYAGTPAALARRHRARGLRPAAFASARKAFEVDRPKYSTVDVTSALCGEAGEFWERHRLRTYDSVHLAAFAEVAP
jgi:predicted nucleic acid-binding protein